MQKEKKRSIIFTIFSLIFAKTMCLCGNKIISNTNLNKLYKFFKKIVAELKIISKFAPMKRQLHLSDKKINILR